MGSEEITIAGVVIGGLLTLVGGIVLAFFTKYYEDNRNKRFTSGAILAEVVENQKQLKLLIEKNHTSTDKHFSKRLYYALLDKVALIHPNTIKYVVKYYAKLEIMNDKAGDFNATHWFYWDDSDLDIKKKVIQFFKDDRDIVIAEANVLINKGDDNARITFCKDEDAFATIELDDGRATLKICDGTTHNLIVQSVNNKRVICYNKTYMMGEGLIEELKKEVEKGLFYFQKAKIKNFFSKS